MVRNTELAVFRLVRRHLFTPIDLIADEVFNGDMDLALAVIEHLVNLNLIEHEVPGFICLTPKGENLLYKPKYSFNSLCY